MTRVTLLAHLLVLPSVVFAVESRPHATQKQTRITPRVIVSPRLAQNNDSNYSVTVENASPEQLPAPTSSEATPQQPRPKQHFIPFAKSDPEAEVVVKDDNGLISLMVRDASLRQVVAMVAETQKLNIVFAAPADIGITAAFEKIPWQQALDSLLTATGHSWTNNNGIIYISSLDTAGMMPPGLAGQHTRIFELDFASAVDVDLTIKGLLSPAGPVMDSRE